MSMRRKSERNKAKGSPEKKSEKPTRKSTRRRGRRSPSSSPDRDTAEDKLSDASSTKEASDKVATSEPIIQTRHQKELLQSIAEHNSEEGDASTTVISTTTPVTGETTSRGKTVAAPATSSSSAIATPTSTSTSSGATNVSSLRKEEDEEEEDNGSVWKVARADASPGEIQKLKLCRQRNTSETSDVLSSRKKSNKWQESSEGTAEEVDSADDAPLASGESAATEAVGRSKEASSTLPGQDSKEEVSDCKEILSETASSANLLSDDKPNIDLEGGPNEETNDNVVQSDSKAADKPDLKANVDDTNGEKQKQERKEVEEEAEKARERAAEEPQQQQQQQETTQEEENKPQEAQEEVGKEVKQSESLNEVVEEIGTKDKKEKVNRVDEESSSDERKKNKSERDSSSNDETRKRILLTTSRAKKSTKTASSRSSRRKHRDKYHDSSNSDTQDSEDEPVESKEPESSDERKAEELENQREKDTRDNGKDEDLGEKEGKRPTTPERRDSIAFNDTKMEVDVTESSNHRGKDVLEGDKATNVSKSEKVLTQKPAKVNLKRSFATRISVDSESKRSEADGNLESEVNNSNKENHSEQTSENKTSLPRKRRWGTTLSTDISPAFSISTDSLKVLVPGAKPLPINEVRLSKDDDEEKEHHREKKHISNESASDHKYKEDSSGPKNESSKKSDAKTDNHIAARRKISIVKETSNNKSPSPPPMQPTSILLIKNLVRPFTLNQIKELLSRTGTIVENGFWMDRIKSKCYVEYSNEDQAFETRQALHGVSWPMSNPKRLQVEYATKEDMESARESSKDQPIRKNEPFLASDSWQQDWSRDERPNAATKVLVVREWDLGKEDGQQPIKEKERDKKENEKKRRQRSRSPALEAHLPAPARKFKKKEDDLPPAKLLDDLFRKTKATPCIYWLPLTNEQIVVKEEMRRQHMAEHARRLEEMRRAERNRDGRRRRSPRK